MKIDILTLFPNMITNTMGQSIIGKAQEKKLIELNCHDFRKYANNKQQHVDDYPYGGGAGMLLMPQPIHDCLEDIKKTEKHRIVLLDPAGKTFNQKMAEDFSNEEQLIFICGHYEGYDERIRSYVTDEVSLGDYVLTGGELGAMVMIDATVRLLSGVLGNDHSAKTDSYSTGLLEHPQYTRPFEYLGDKVPEVLMSGHHENIRKWKIKESLRRTVQRRPELLKNIELTEEQEKYLKEVLQEENKEI